MCSRILSKIRGVIKKFNAYILGLIDILGMSKVLARWWLQLLTDVQRKSWLHVSRYLLSMKMIPAILSSEL